MNELAIPTNLDKLKAFLGQMISITQQYVPAEQRWKYSCCDEMILKHGASANPKPLPENISKGMPRYCYYNCQQLVLTNNDLTYVEGYAIPENSLPGDLSFLSPINHAWLLDRDAAIIDPTWEPFGLVYLGIPFSTAWLKSVWAAREEKEPDNAIITIIQGNYMDDFFIAKEGFPSGAIIKVP
jgi:hypothetical protein